MTSFVRCRSRWFYDQFYTYFSETLTVQDNEAQFACVSSESLQLIHGMSDLKMERHLPFYLTSQVCYKSHIKKILLK